MWPFHRASNLERWAKAELDILLNNAKKDEEDPDMAVQMQAHMNRHLLRMVREFCKEGQSGLSAGYAVNRLKRLLMWLPLAPLTGEDSEWNDVGDGVEQNRRCSKVFRNNKDNATATNIEGKVFSDNDGQSWFTCHASRVPITFPYRVPDEPEYIILKDGEDPC